MEKTKTQNKQELEEVGKKKEPELCRRWFLTVHAEHLACAPTQAGVASLLDSIFRDNKIDFLAWVLEKGEKKEHLHIHIYAELPGPQRMSYWQKIFGKKGDFAYCRGSQQDSLDYIFRTGLHADKPQSNGCGKIGIPHTVAPESNKCYGQAVNMVLEGKSISQVALYLGGGILPQIGNLCRLKASIEEEKFETTRCAFAAKTIGIIK